MRSPLFSLIAAGLLWSTSLLSQELFRYPFVGAVTDRSATVTVWLASPESFSIEYSLDSAMTSATLTPTLTSSADQDNVVKVVINDLAPNSRYYYRIVTPSREPVSKRFSFRTFPESGADAPVTLLFGSCSRNSFQNIGKTFVVGGKLGGDYFIHLGDWSYPDELVEGFPTRMGSIRESYATRLDTTYSFVPEILSRMGIAYEWDDHDFAGDNGDGSIDSTLKRELLEAYRRYIPHYRLENPNAGLWHSFRIGSAEVFMLDARAQRSPVDSAFRNGTFAPPPGHSMLAGYPVQGVDQRTWLLNAIRSSTARWKIVASQGPFNPQLGLLIPAALLFKREDIARETAEYWVGYPADVDSMRNLLQGSAGRNLLIIAGSVHNNLFDNGDHSIVPEFVAANLDIPNSRLYDTLKRYGLNIFTGGQPNSKSTIGRIRIETDPVHKLIVESFDEDGEPVLSYEMTDRSSGVEPIRSDARNGVRVREARTVENGTELRLELVDALDRNGNLAVYDMQGELLLEWNLDEGTRIVTIPLGRTLPSGSYSGTITAGDVTTTFRFNIVR